jgi:ATP-binding cassette subfamily F protein 3
MLHLINLSMSFAGQELFRNLDWHIRKQDRVGLVGANGTGKTTLLKIISGQIEPDTGQTRQARGTIVGYLPQEGLQVVGRSLFAEASSALPQLTNIQAELVEIQSKLGRDGAERDEHLLLRYGELQHRFEELEGFRADAEVAKVLRGLGFHEDQFNRPTDTFSGGWQMRIALAKLLLQKPDLLLLDEPTNHLDLDSLIWLEGYLRAYAGSIVIVSHDRAFLDRLVTRIVALDRRTLTEYPGNYSNFERQHEHNFELYRKAYEQQQEEIERIKHFIDSFRYNARKAPQVQSRIKYLQKLERLEPPQDSPRQVHFSFPSARRSGRIVLELKDVGKRYGTLEVFKNINLVIERGDKVALVGINGVGKSTLSRIIAGLEEPTNGQRRVGYQVDLDHFAQSQAERLQGEHTVYQEVMQGANLEMASKLRGLLGAFLFSGDDVEKRVAVLSGGEKSRLAIAKMLLRPVNFLVLDEPTNYLDIRTKDVFKEALQQFTGTVLIVSHDRYFLGDLVNKVIEMKEGALSVYPGTFAEFLKRKESEVGEGGTQDSERSPGSGETGGSTLSTGHRPPAVGMEIAGTRVKPGRALLEQQRASRSERQKQERRLVELEEQIQELEGRKAEIEALLANSDLFTDHGQAREVAAEHQKVVEELEQRFAHWAALVEGEEE